MASPRRRPLFLLCGDSLTQRGSELALDGWVALVQDVYVRSVDVLNRGLSGYTSRWFCEYALPALRDELQHSQPPSLITLWLGANDAALSHGPASMQHVPLDEFKQNLIVIIQEFQRLAPKAKILVITPPVVDDECRQRIRINDYGASPSDPIDRMNEETAKYAQACAEVVATVDGVVLLDMYSYLMTQYPDPLERAKLLSDGLHFSKAGNRVVFEEIQRYIHVHVPDFDTWQLPDWKTLG